MNSEWAANSYLMFHKLLSIINEFEAYGIIEPTKIWYIGDMNELCATWGNDTCAVTLYVASEPRSAISYRILTGRTLDGWTDHNSDAFEYVDIPRKIWDTMENNFMKKEETQ